MVLYKNFLILYIKNYLINNNLNLYIKNIIVKFLSYHERTIDKTIIAINKMQHIKIKILLHLILF